MYEYIKIAWRVQDGVDIHEGYQEILNGYVQRNTDLEGNTVVLEDCTSWVIDPSPEPPVWGT
jgi:hypothetical protein